MESYADIVRRCYDARRVTPGNTEYNGWSLDEVLEGSQPIKSIDELRIPGLSEVEADEFWHAVNDA